MSDERRIGWGPNNVGARVRRKKKVRRPFKDHGVIESSYYDSAFGPGVVIRHDDGDISCITGAGQLNDRWELSEAA